MLCLPQNPPVWAIGRRGIATLMMLSALNSAAAEVRPLEAPAVDIIGETPLPGIGVSRNRMAGNVQTISDEQLEHARSSSLPDYMVNHMGSMNGNEVAGNPFQMDLGYRGFYASPLMGMPQGLAVYLDGMRLNEPFGDTVSWDLIPRNALAGANLLSGANPAFGMNALGGAIVLGTKSGDTHPGSEAELSIGAYGREEMSVAHGGGREGLSWFFAGNQFKDDGWRDGSPSRVSQLFAKVGQQTVDTDLDLSFGVTNSVLAGNGLTPQSLLEDRFAAVYTRPDETRNQAWFANLRFDRQLSGNGWLGSNVYFRSSRMRSQNPDVNQVRDDRYGVTAYEDGDPNPASMNRQGLDQETLGINLQATRQGEAGKQLTLGVATETSRADYRRTYQLGNFTAERSVQVSGVETEIVKVSGRTNALGLFAIWNTSIGEGLHLNVSSRYNHMSVKVDDHLPTSTIIAGSHGLDADYSFQRINPAVGLVWEGAPNLTAYASLGQSNRAPTPIELACADPNAACLLPNAMQSDPPLKQVVTRSIEGGLRGRVGEGWRWNAGVYRADNQDDILFVATTGGGLGYFQNFGRTRRQGLELGIAGEAGAWSLDATYSLVDATFQSPTTVMSPSNSQADAVGNITIDRGNTIPGIPRHQLKIELTRKLSPHSRLSGQLVAFSSQYARGNENNADPSGVVAGYALVHLNGETDLGGGWTLFGKVNNLFDRRYATAGQLAANAFASGNFNPVAATWGNEIFLAPGAPRAIFMGLRYRL